MTLLRFVAAAVAVLLALPGCGVRETYEPTLVAKVTLDPGKYSVLVDRLDAEMGRFGLMRYSGSKALQKLYQEQHGREALFFAYQFKLEDKLRFLNASDLKKVGVVEISLLPEAFSDENTRREAVSRVGAVVADFGAKLEPFRRTELKRE